MQNVAEYWIYTAKQQSYAHSFCITIDSILIEHVLRSETFYES